VPGVRVTPGAPFQIADLAHILPHARSEPTGSVEVAQRRLERVGQSFDVMKVCAPDEVAVEIDQIRAGAGGGPPRPRDRRVAQLGPEVCDEADLWLRRQLEGLIQAALESTGRLINEFSGNAREAARHRLRVVDGGGVRWPLQERAVAARDALDDDPASALAPVDDRDARAHAELFHDQPGREWDPGGVAQDEMVRVLFLEDADHHA
jgi:hypothetical protein